MTIEEGSLASEARVLAIGKAGERFILVAFTLRMRSDNVPIRPISARYMHRKEIAHYERQREA